MYITGDCIFEKKVIKSVVQRERISGTLGSDCNEEDMLGSAQSYIVLCIVLLFESFIVLPFFCIHQNLLPEGPT